MNNIFYFLLFLLTNPLLGSASNKASYLVQSVSFKPGKFKAYKKYNNVSHLSFAAEFQYLNSTHITPFLGTSLICTYNISSLILGVGAEYTYASFHNDNTWKLHNLKFVPVYFDFKYSIKMNKLFTSYLQFSPGITFMHYEREDQSNMGKPYSVEEKGVFVFAGVGLLLNVHHQWKPSASVGFKGFNMSANVLDVNPHGFTMKVGLSFYFK